MTFVITHCHLRDIRFLLVLQRVWTSQEYDEDNSYPAGFIAVGVNKETSFTVTALPPGKHKPTATITKPAKNITVGYGGDILPKIDFAGVGDGPRLDFKGQSFEF